MSRMLMVAMLFVTGAVSAAPVDLFSPAGGQAKFTRGVDRYVPVRIERGALDTAAAEGGMWLPQPDGGRVFVRTVSLTSQAGGIKTWVGKLALAGGERSVVVTMGPDATFGSLLTKDGKPFRLITENGRAYMVEKDASATLLRAGRQAPRAPERDYLIPPREPQAAIAGPSTQAAPSLAGASASQSGTVDVLLAYTPGMVNRYGSTSAVVTRLNYLVAVANQAYADSQVKYRVRLAGTMAVNYSDTGANSQVLSDLTNTSSSGPLASVRTRRAALGADLASLVRPFLTNGQGGYCGLAYLIGANQSSFTTQSAPYGYSTLGDGEDPSTNEYCADTTLAHELGHNMGLAHDKANAPEPGAYSYAYGWRQTLSSGSFSTIMAYPTGGQERVPYFANPDITLCNGNRCGDPTTANQTLVLNQTMPTVAGFMTSRRPALDLNSDHEADVVLQPAVGGSYAYMYEGADFNPTDGAVQTVSAGYRIAAAGDFNGDGATDLIWTSAANDLFFWLNNGAGGYQSQTGPTYAAGWTIVGTGDLNGDGTDDLLWSNPTTNQFAYWNMRGASVLSTRLMSVTAGYRIGAIGDFNGDGRADIVWTSPARDLYVWTTGSTGAFTGTRAQDYPAGWQLAGSGDMNGDGRADLVWLNSTDNQFGYWTMNGSTRTGYRIFSVAPGYTIAAIDQFGGSADGILWTSAARDLYVWQNNGAGAFSSARIAAYPDQSGGYLDNYPSGWSVVSRLPVNP